jgi:hypothetical protein
MDTILDNIPIDMFVSDIEEKPIENPKKRKPRTRKTYREETAWRRRPDGTYNTAPKDPAYFRMYMMQPIACPLCTIMTRRGHMSRHKKSALCMKVQSIISNCRTDSS